MSLTMPILCFCIRLYDGGRLGLVPFHRSPRTAPTERGTKLPYPAIREKPKGAPYLWLRVYQPGRKILQQPRCRVRRRLCLMHLSRLHAQRIKSSCPCPSPRLAAALAISGGGRIKHQPRIAGPLGFHRILPMPAPLRRK
jgi:hypothetical protein